jgi:hypothetical protein
MDGMYMNKGFSPLDNGEIISAQIIFLSNSKVDRQKRKRLLETTEWHWVASDITWAGEQYHILARRTSTSDDGGGDEDTTI